MRIDHLSGYRFGPAIFVILILTVVSVWALPALGDQGSWTGPLWHETTAEALSLDNWPAETRILVVQNDPSAEPAQTLPGTAAPEMPLRPQPGPALAVPGESGAASVRIGCGDEGFDTYPYAVSDPPVLSYVWLAADTMYGDDLTLEDGEWDIGCYDVFIYADNDPYYGCQGNRTVTLRAHEYCNGPVLSGSEETWTVPPYGGPVLLTGVTNIDFKASGTIWFSLTTTSQACDGWYAGNTNPAGSTTIDVQEGDNCQQFIEGEYNKFHVVLYGELRPDPTVFAYLDCRPESGHLPFVTVMEATLFNATDLFARRFFGRIDLMTAGGQFYFYWRTGFTNVQPNSGYTAAWNQTIPALGSLIGDNTFYLFSADVTPPPFNQPPYPPAGDTATDSCVVSGQYP